MGFPGGSDGKGSAFRAGDRGSIPGSGRSPGGGHGNPLQGSCVEKPTDRGAWRATAHGLAESDTTERLTLHNQVLARLVSCCPFITTFSFATIIHLRQYFLFLDSLSYSWLPGHSVLQNFVFLWPTLPLSALLCPTHHG